MLRLNGCGTNGEKDGEKMEKSGITMLMDEYDRSEEANAAQECGNYRILEDLGTRKTGSLFLVSRKRTGERFLMKSCSAGRTHAQREIDMLSMLDHPRIPKLVEVFEADGQMHLVREYVQGESLNDLLSRQQLLPERTVADWGLQIARILAYLHKMKPHPVIHRDLKPGNLILDPTGNIWLIDFGAARTYKAAEKEDTEYLGTVGYAAPEQYGFRQTDPRSDIFAFGMVMFTLLAGHPPERGKPVPSIRGVRSDISRDMDAIIRKCTQFNPDTRFSDAEELSRAMQRCKPLRAPGKGVFLRGLLAGVLLGGLLGTGFALALRNGLTDAVLSSASAAEATFPSESDSDDVLPSASAGDALLLSASVEIEPVSSDVQNNSDLQKNSDVVPTIVASDSTESFPYGLLMKSLQAPQYSGIMQMGMTGEGGPDMDADGRVEVSTYVYWAEKIELHMGWRDNMEAFDLKEAIPSLAYDENGLPREGLKMEMQALDLNADGVLEMLVMVGDAFSQSAFSVIGMDKKSQTFHVCGEKPVGGRYAYIDDAGNIVVPPSEMGEGGTYRYHDEELLRLD